MFSVSSVEKAVRGLYRDGTCEAGYTEESVTFMLDQIDFHALAQAACHNAGHVHAFTVNSTLPGYFSYRGRDLFGQRAALLYEDPDDSVSDSPDASRVYELWLLEDSQMAVASRVTMALRCPARGQCVCVYRDIRRHPWQSEMCLDLESLTTELRKLCLPVYRNKVPVYEM